VRETIYQSLVPVKGACKSEVVIAGELAHARVELAVVHETTRFVNDEEGEDNPAFTLVRGLACIESSPYIMAGAVYVVYWRRNTTQLTTIATVGDVWTLDLKWGTHVVRVSQAQAC
jgi:hypothetical protein